MGRAKRTRKKARRKNRELREEMRAAQERARRTRLVVLTAIPLLTLGTAAALYWGVAEPRWAGAVLLAGMLTWLMAGLGYLGSTVNPRDRHRAGSIDFGQRR